MSFTILELFGWGDRASGAKPLATSSLPLMLGYLRSRSYVHRPLNWTELFRVTESNGFQAPPFNVVEGGFGL